MSKTQNKKEKKLDRATQDKPIEIGYSFYHNGKEYVVKARNRIEAGDLFIKLIEND